MLEANVASHVIKGNILGTRDRLVGVPPHDVTVSVVTQAELLYGVAKRGHPGGLSARVREFLIRVDVLPWEEETARVYGDLRAACERAGVSLSPLDMMIAAHAKAVGAVLVSRDRAFTRVPVGLDVQDWAR